MTTTTASAPSLQALPLRFPRLLTTHPGVIVDAAALLSAHRATPADTLSPLFSLLFTAREKGCPVLLYTERPGEEDELQRHGVPRLWTVILEPGPLTAVSKIPFVRALSLDRANKVLLPMPALWPTVYGELIGDPQHPARVEPLTAGMIGLRAAGYNDKQIAELIAEQGDCHRSTPSNALNAAAMRRGCLNTAHLVARDIVDGYLDPEAALRRTVGEPDDLSEVQREVLVLSLESNSLTGLALRLGCTRPAANKHKRGTLEALGARTVTHATAIALALGYLPDHAVPARSPYPPDLRKAKSLQHGETAPARTEGAERP
ncbi:helix-turn-helix transcriptional regulator [Kitasatospora sp. NRRL B-11411]|uniref:helix-turn-helix transcriptional regulator n=1 Tax=Kitasatospora sp. NRRL B-11411 TaxID=1463822 RepID=UPI0004C39A17|nr:helix-turn-helix transcriptional regulator [Kitasatospora sp. NRRL B-11411]